MARRHATLAASSSSHLKVERARIGLLPDNEKTYHRGMSERVTRIVWPFSHCKALIFVLIETDFGIVKHNAAVCNAHTQVYGG